MKHRVLFLVLSLPCAAMAQEYDLHIAPAKGVKLRTRIETSSERTTSSTTLVNGEERQGRFGGGGERTLTSSQKIEFDEEVAKTDEAGLPLVVKRNYLKLNGESTFPGRDGEQTREITGALEGKPLFIIRDGDETTVHDGKEDGPEIDQQLIRGLQIRSDLAGLTPKTPVALQGEFNLDETFRDALRNLSHPMIPEIQAQPAGDTGGRRGRRGGQRGMRMRGMGGNPNLRNLLNDKLDLSAKGKLISIDEIDGVNYATVEIKAKVSGDGDPQELGLGAARFGGRRGGNRGNRQMPETEGHASISVKIEGNMIINLSTHCLKSLALEGENESSNDMSFSMERNGQSMDFERSSEESGTFNIKVSVAPAPSGGK